MARLNPKIRKEKILLAALEVARKGAYVQMSAEDVATVADMSRGLITRYFGSMVGLKKAVMKRAVELELCEILIQGLAINCSIAKAAPIDLKRKTLARYAS